MFNYLTIQKARPRLIFINIARGDISPIEDLKKLIDNKILGGVGLDVYLQESTLAHHLRNDQKHKTAAEQIIMELSEREEVLFTPHNAFNTQEALEQKAALSVVAMIHYKKHGAFPCPVPFVSPAPRVRLKESSRDDNVFSGDVR